MPPLPVLLIHGTAPQFWGDVPEALGCEVLAYDRRTFGDDARERPASLSVHAADAADLVRERADGSVVVVGWSVGGVIALELAARSPELVAGLVLLEPPLHAKRHPRPAMIAAIGRATVLGKLGRHRAGAHAFLRWALDRRDGGNDLERLPAEWQARVDRDARAVVDELALGTGEHLSADDLRAITAPTRVLTGGQSSPVFGAAAARVAAAVPRAELVELPRSGHVIQRDEPASVASAATGLMPC